MPPTDAPGASLDSLTPRDAAGGASPRCADDPPGARSAPPAPVSAHPLDPRILDALAEGIFLVDGSWRITHVNAAAERATGVPRGALVGRVLWETFPTLSESPLGLAVRDAVRERGSRSLRSVPLARVPGGPVVGVFDARATPLDDGSVLLSFREVSRREQERRALAAESAENLRLRQLARALAAEDDPARLLDDLCRAAAALCDASGGTVAEVEDDAAQFVAAHGHPAGVVGHRFPLVGTLTGRVRDAHVSDPHGAVLLRAEAEEADDAAFCPWLSDGRRVGPLLLAALCAHGTLLGVLAISRGEGEPCFSDADEARLRVVADHASLALWNARLVEDARVATRTQNSFLATVSHELRTPLTALTGYGELLSDGILGPLTGDQREVVERMRTVTHQLTAMIEEILTFSALEAGREVVRLGPVDVPELVRAVQAVIEPLAAAKQLPFTVTVAPGLPPLVSDAEKLRQILVNLCGNAVKFTERGAVQLTVAADAEAVHWTVADTGIGIAKRDLARLFQPFTQLDDGLTRRHGGTGLGLYIAQRLARLLGGRIEVTSTPKVGSVFTLVLPVGGT